MKVGIVGLGLIGGSLGWDLRSQGIEVFGVSRRDRTCEVARDRGVVDRASVKLSCLAGMDVIFICTPLTAIAPTVTQLLPYLSPETVLTDVGSVKQSIVADCSALWPNFIGGHPMAGTAEQGIEAAQRHLFVGAPYVLTPTETTPAGAIERVESIARSLGSQVYFCQPEEHDRAVALVSHLPLLASAGLIDACLRESDPTVLNLAQHLASSGFRDTSRVGGGNPELGVAIAQFNRSSVLRSLYQYRHSLDRFIAAIEGDNWPELEALLQTTQRTRPQFLREENGD